MSPLSFFLHSEDGTIYDKSIDSSHQARDSHCSVLAPWLIETTVTYLDVKRLTSEKVLLTKKVDGILQPSEYQVQSEFSAKAKALHSKLNPRVARRYKVMREAFAPGRGNRARLDLLICNGKWLRLGQELLVAGTQRDFDSHHARAKKYAHEHDCVTWCIDISLSQLDTGKPLVLPQATDRVRIDYRTLTHDCVQ